MKAKKLLLGFIVCMLLFSQVIFAIPISELDSETKDMVLSYVSEKITDVPITSLEALDGQRYEILDDTGDYLLIEIDGVIYVVPES